MGATRRLLAILLLAGSLPVLHGCGSEAGAGPEDPGPPGGAPGLPEAPATPPAEGPPPQPGVEPAAPPAEGPPPQPGVEPAAVSPGIQVSFFLERGLPTSDQAGDDWVTPAIFTQVGDGPGMQIRARARRADDRGDAHGIHALWDADDMLALSSRHGEEVTLTVLRAGEGRLTVRDRGGSRRLTVTAVEEGGVLTVRLFQ